MAVLTVRVTDPWKSPEAALMVADPAFFAVTRPLLTSATVASLLDQVAVAVRSWVDLSARSAIALSVSE